MMKNVKASLTKHKSTKLLENIMCLLFTAKLALLATISLTISCSTTIEYKYPAVLLAKSHTKLSIAVYDFVDSTNEKHVVGSWESSAWVYDNLTTLTADVVASVLKDSGYFEKVERIRKKFNGNAFEGYDVIVSGEIKEFKTGLNVPFFSLINPISLGHIIGIPSLYVYDIGKSNVKVVLMDAKTQKQIDELAIASNYPETSAWGSWITTRWIDRQRRGTETAKVFAKELAKQIKERLQKGLGQTFLAMNIQIQDSTFAQIDQFAEVSATSTSLDLGTYNALVIGINNYQHLKDLKTANNDASTIANLLQNQYGFRVEVLLNPNRAKVLTAINRYRRLLTSKDNLLIYYAGHGWLDKDADQGYWLPANATKENQVEWISNSAITAEIRAIQAKHIMIVSDSCYSGKLTRGLLVQPKTPNYFTRISRKKARVVLSSGGLEPVADGGGENHSVFASAFIAALRENTNIMDGNALFNKIRRPVMVNSDQTPEYADIHKAGHDGGDFIFVRKK